MGIILKYWKQISIVLIFIGMIFTINYQHDKIIEKDRQISQSVINNKAYSQENKALKDKQRVFEFTIDQMESFYADSINKILIDRKNQLKIKDNNIKELQYYKESFGKTDTVKFFQTDTILAPGVNIDTTLIDSSYTLKIKLIYPGTFIVGPKFTNEKIVAVHAKRETIDPPKKFFIARWFQKKQTVLLIDVKDTNPFIDDVERRFIKILGKDTN